MINTIIFKMINQFIESLFIDFSLINLLIW